MTSTVDALRARWAAGHASYGGWMVTPEPYLAEALARCGYDEVTLDLQHSTTSIEDLSVLCMAVTAGGAAPLVRTPPFDPVTINKVLDLGAGGVIVAMVETAEEAAAVVAACRYPPHGTRSAGAMRARYTLGRSDLEGLAAALKFVMVETATGLRNAAEIAATPGLDGIYVGPGDLGISMGMPVAADRSDAERAEFDAAIDRVVAVCDAAGIVAGIHTGDGVTAASYVQRGYRMVTVVADIGQIVAGGLRELGIAVGASGSHAGGDRPARFG